MSRSVFSWWSSDTSLGKLPTSMRSAATTVQSGIGALWGWSDMDTGSLLDDRFQDWATLIYFAFSDRKSPISFLYSPCSTTVLSSIANLKLLSRFVARRARPSSLQYQAGQLGGTRMTSPQVNSKFGTSLPFARCQMFHLRSTTLMNPHLTSSFDQTQETVVEKRVVNQAVTPVWVRIRVPVSLGYAESYKM